jgi:penicillin amidase
MKNKIFILSILFAAVFTIRSSAQDVVSNSLEIEGVNEAVQIIKDKWGVSHIYAQNEADLFFAQGYNAARDRLFQFEIWRRQTNGTVAEITGQKDLKRDIGTRLFMFRGDIEKEMNHYHPRGSKIITSYVKGVNAYIERTENNPDLLPMQFNLLGIKPGKWTPQTVISRHQGLLGNINAELNYGRMVDLVGAEKVKGLNYFHPWGEPDIKLDNKIDGSLLHKDILGLYNAFRRPVDFTPDDIAAVNAKGNGNDYKQYASTLNKALERRQKFEREDIGSNNWVVSGDLTQNGYPMMANDPHRTQAVPALRYIVHLVAPGWNVIGGGEPEIPGISIGHNEYGAWGLTVFSTDGEDLYVYETNPDNPSQYKYEDTWVDMDVIEETFDVKNGEAVTESLKYTNHGPVVYEDNENNLAYAVRAAWMEIGGAPYLASLRMDQAETWEEFRDASNYSNIPGENMVWADKDGNIGWQSVGIAPIRRNWSGLVPVPGDGSYEWEGYLPIKKKPHIYNPKAGFFGTANSNLTPKDYPYRDEAIGWSWADPYRWARIEEVLGSGRKFSMADMMELQTDYLSIPARTLTPFLASLKANNEKVEKARKMLLNWDYVLNKNSVEAAIYNSWELEIEENMRKLLVPKKIEDLMSGLSMKKMIDWLVSADAKFGKDPIEGRNELLLNSLSNAVRNLEKRLGPDMDNWQYGQEAYKHITLKSPLSGAVNGDLQEKLEVGPLPRGGSSYTLNNTGSNDNQSSGPSFRIIVDLEDWDKGVAMNNPGQSDDPESKHYDNLFELWANDNFFPLLYSKDKIESVADEKIVLEPKN